MKAFFEEYGFVLVSVAVIAMLIGIVGDSGEVQTKITDGLKNTIDGMTEKLAEDFPTAS